MNPEEIIAFLSKYYIWEIVIMVIAIGLTMLIKLPIKKRAVALEEKYGVDKSILTWTIAFIPYILVGIMVFVLYWYKSNWALQFSQLEWASILAETSLIASGSIGLYEAVKKIIQGSKAIQEKKKAAKEPEQISYRVKEKKKNGTK